MQRIFSSPDPKGLVRAIATTQCPLSTKFYILIFFSQTTGPIETKLGRNFHWMVPFKVYVFLLLIRNTQKKQEAQSYQKGCVHYKPYVYILFILT